MKRSLLRGALCTAAALGVWGGAFSQTQGSPASLTPVVPAKVTLDPNDSAYFKVYLPAGRYKFVLDMRNADGKSANLASKLSLIDADGATVADGIIMFNEIGRDYRRVYDFTAKKATGVRFKLTDGLASSTFWLTVVSLPAERGPRPILSDDMLKNYDPKLADWVPFPFCGTVTPHYLAVGDTASLSLDADDSAYYLAVLPAGTYKLVATWENPDHNSTNLQGYIAQLKADGSGEKQLLGFNEIDVTSTKSSTFTVKADSVVVFRVLDSGRTNNIQFKVTPTPAQ